MADSPFQPFEVGDFTGGITDDVFDQDYTQSEELDNFNITSDKKLASRSGSVVDDLTNPQIPAGVQRIGTLINYNNSTKLFVQSARKFYYRNPSAYATLTGPTGNDVLSVGDTSSIISFSEFNQQLFVTSDVFPKVMKLYRDGSGVYQVRNAGLPALASSPTVTVGAAGTKQYIYAFHYRYEYTVGDQTFEDVGPVTFVSLANSADPSVTPNNISVIPVLSNGVTDNHDTSNLKVYIYRTLDSGDTFFKIGEVTNGTTTFVDSFADSAIENNLLLYTDDGTLDFQAPPLSKYVHVVNATGIYGHVKVGSQVFKNRLQFSVPGNPGACPNGLELDVEDEIAGVSSTQSIPIVLCKRHIYSLQGSFDQFGRGNVSSQRISDTAGCVSSMSCVQAEGNLYWAGNDGFYTTDGYRVIKISDGLNTRYKNLFNKHRIVGRFDEKERRIYWAVQKDSANLDNDCLMVLELRFGISQRMPFSTYSGTSFAPTSHAFFNNSWYRADKRGFVFLHSDDYETDPKIDTVVTPSNWKKETIIWRYKSLNLNFGSNFYRKYVTKILLTASNRANTSIQINAVNDDGKLTRELKSINWRRNFIWGDDDFVWGNASCVWNAVGLIEQWRRFPAKGLRLSYVQIEITNGFSVVANSDTIGKATFNPALNTVVLDDSLGQDWPIESVDYQIFTEVDNYTQGFTVLTRGPDTLTVADPNNTLPTGSLKWVLKGYKKGEPLNLLSYNLHWDNISQTQATFESGDDGGNA